jgi:hypothetical protein
MIQIHNSIASLQTKPAKKTVFHLLTSIYNRFYNYYVTCSYQQMASVSVITNERILDVVIVIESYVGYR